MQNQLSYVQWATNRITQLLRLKLMPLYRILTLHVNTPADLELVESNINTTLHDLRVPLELQWAFVEGFYF